VVLAPRGRPYHLVRLFWHSAHRRVRRLQAAWSCWPCLGARPKRTACASACGPGSKAKTHIDRKQQASGAARAPGTEEPWAYSGNNETRASLQPRQCIHSHTGWHPARSGQAVRRGHGCQARWRGHREERQRFMVFVTPVCLAGFRRDTTYRWVSRPVPRAHTRLFVIIRTLCRVYEPGRCHSCNSVILYWVGARQLV
jgi:hypothetical protein